MARIPVQYMKAGQRVRVRGHHSKPGKGLTYLGFTGTLLEDAAPGGWDVVDVRSRNGVQSVYAFSLEPARGHASNPPRRTTPLEGPVTGYINRASVGQPMVSFSGKETPWLLYEIVQLYHNHYGDKSAAVILKHERREQYAVGYLLIDGGSLFRGEHTSARERRDMRLEAKAEAESWAERDAEDEMRDEFED